MLEAIKETPLWVWIIFAYLLIKGFKATTTRTVFFPKIFIVPAIFLAWSLTRLFTYYTTDILHLGSYFIALSLGSWGSFLWARKRNVIINRSNKTITLPGSWSTLILILSIFIISYTFGYLDAVYPTSEKSMFIFRSCRYPLPD
ncbi:MAG: DUF6622 family protein [Chlamydiota bacterium]